MVTKFYKIYGKEGHRQKMSFEESKSYDFSKNGNIREVTILNSDILGHNDFSIIQITRNTLAEVKAELQSQLEDGLFECCNYGKVEELKTFKLKNK